MQQSDGDLGQDGEVARNLEGSILSMISRDMVKLYKEQFGRGPTKASSRFAGPDTLLCTLEDSFNPAERRLVELGEHQRLRNTRLYLQHATKQQFCDLIEAHLGRRVRAFVSGLDAVADVSAEIFYLEPQPGAADEDIP